MNFWELFLTFFAVYAFIQALWLLGKKSEYKKANRIWALFLVLFGLNILYNVLYWSDWIPGLADRFAFFWMIPFSLYGPLFYIYIHSLGGKKEISWSTLVHILPFFLVLFNFGPYLFLPLETKYEVLRSANLATYFRIPREVFFWGLTFLTLGYAYYSYVKGSGLYHKDVEMRLWLKLITFSFAGFGLFWLAYFTLSALGVLSLEQDYMLTFFMVLFIGLTSYFGSFHGAVFNGTKLNKIFPFVKYKNSGLSKPVLQDYRIKLEKLMTEKELFLESELKLTDLAEHLHVTRHHASQIINESFEMSFYEFLNRYRIEEAERLMNEDEGQELNITDIAYKSGFNNRISFYNAFKKYLGTTPSAYRNRDLAS